MIFIIKPLRKQCGSIKDVLHYISKTMNRRKEQKNHFRAVIGSFMRLERMGLHL